MQGLFAENCRQIWVLWTKIFGMMRRKRCVKLTRGILVFSCFHGLDFVGKGCRRPNPRNDDLMWLGLGESSQKTWITSDFYIGTLSETIRNHQKVQKMRSAAKWLGIISSFFFCRVISTQYTEFTVFGPSFLILRWSPWRSEDTGIPLAN